MRVALMIEGQDGPLWEDWLALGVSAEEAGLEALFRSDHYAPIDAVAEAPALDAWATVAGLAAATNRLRLGVLVSPVTFRPPAVLAKLALTCDHISGGRVEVGVGAGWYEADHSRFGLPFPDPPRRLLMLEEQLQILKKLWSGERFDFEGSYYSLRGCVSAPQPVQKPHPPLIVGGRGGPRSVGVAARWADEYNTVFADEEGCLQVRKRLDDACRSVGRDPETLPMSLMTACVTASGRRDLDDRLRAVAALKGCPDTASLLSGPASTWIVGTSDEVVDRLRALRRAGVSRVMLQHLLFEDVDAVAEIGAVAEALR